MHAIKTMALQDMAITNTMVENSARNKLMISQATLSLALTSLRCLVERVVVIGAYVFEAPLLAILVIDQV